MFKAKCVTFKDKDGKPYMFRARSNSFLYNLSNIGIVLFYLDLLLSFIAITFADIGEAGEVTFRAVTVILSLIALIFIGHLMAKRIHTYSFTVRFSSLIFNSCAKSESIVFCLNNTTIEFEGYSTTVSDNNNSVSVPYFSKGIDDSLVKFLSDVGISDNSQKEEPS